MPIYEYRCDNGHTFDVMQRMADDPLSTCQVCEAPVQKVLSPVAVHFKGSGFYTTDYGKKKSPAGGAGDAKKGDSGGSSESSSESGSSSSDSGSSGSDSGSKDKTSSGSESAKASTKSA
ncbi:MAG: FmdB family zinc ribbon protein [Thermoleophilaceae bacterium]